MIAVAVLICTASFAQQGKRGNISKRPGAQSEKVENARIAYINKEVKLDEKEAKQFWPVYDKYQKRLRTNHVEKMNRQKRLNDSMDDMSDSEKEQLMDEMDNLDQDSAKIQKEMRNDLKTVLSTDKIARLKKAESDFKKMLIDKIGKNK